MVHEKLARQMVFALRGERSRASINRKVGFGDSACYRWENTNHTPKMTVFCDLAVFAGVDVSSALANFAPLGELRLPKRLDAVSFGQWLRHLTADYTTAKLARALDCNRNTVRRWFEGKTEPRLVDVLRIVDLVTGRLLDFVAVFVNPETLPITWSESHALDEKRRIAYRVPWSRAIFRALELDGYRALRRHREGFIARAIGIPVDDEGWLVWQLASARQIKKRALKYCVRVPFPHKTETPASSMATLLPSKRATTRTTPT